MRPTTLRAVIYTTAGPSEREDLDRCLRYVHGCGYALDSVASDRAGELSAWADVVRLIASGVADLVVVAPGTPPTSVPVEVAGPARPGTRTTRTTRRPQRLRHAAPPAQNVQGAQ